MILFVCVNLNDIFEQGRNFKWKKPDTCPRCNSTRVWGHGFVPAFFDGFDQGLFLRRYRYPDCKCITRMKPRGYFPRFQTRIHVIRSCLDHRLSKDRWPASIPTSRMRHWLAALKRKAWAFLAQTEDLMAAFDRLVEMDRIPVSRSI